MTPAAWRLIQLVADLDAGEQIIEENDTTKLVRNGNGALLRSRKDGSGASEHVDFLVKDRAGWQKHIRHHLVNKNDYERRIDFAHYREVRDDCARKNVFFTPGVTAAFDAMNELCGHENVLMGMAMDPDWVRDMCDLYATVTVDTLEILFAREGLPDGLWVWDDLGFKQRPFMSPAMYRELIQPAHARTIQWAHQRGLKVIMHSCGMIEPLLPGMIEAGIDMLQAMEVKAGMDMVRLNKLYGDKIGFFGNIDIREIITNDRSRIDAELKKKILPLMKTKTPYILGSDHSTPPEVDYETFLYFRDRGLELARY